MTEKPKIDSLGLGKVTGLRTEPEPERPKYDVAPSRQGKAGIMSYHDPAVAQQLKVLAAEQATTQQDLIAEALNMLFARYNRAQIAQTRRRS